MLNRNSLMWLLFASVTEFGLPSLAFAPVTLQLQQNKLLPSRLFYADDKTPHHHGMTRDLQRQQWMENSVSYYSKVMREERRRTIGQAKHYDKPEYQDNFTALAKKHYFALRKIKDGKPRHAEAIYRRIINELRQQQVHGECDHAKLAVTTLLLALLLQRSGNVKGTRSVFLNFFRVAVVENQETECACSAKVMQAFALFEMKQGNALKSLELVRKAIVLDPTLEPVLNWKQFRDVVARRSDLRP